MTGQLLFQVALGSVVLMISVMMGAIAALLMEMGFERYHDWLMTEPHRPKLLLAVMAASVWVLATITGGVWLWTAVYDLLGVFPTLEESLYFAIVTYTTLGFGDVLLPPEWRVLSGMTSANGFLNFGLMTALLIEAMRHVRTNQVQSRGARRKAKSKAAGQGVEARADNNG